MFINQDKINFFERKKERKNVKIHLKKYNTI